MGPLWKAQAQQSAAAQELVLGRTPALEPEAGVGRVIKRRPGSVGNSLVLGIEEVEVLGN